jgi:hypothetical protein
MAPSALFWTAIAAGGLVCLVAWAWYQRRKDDDLGVISHQWLAEQRQRTDSASQR